MKLIIAEKPSLARDIAQALGVTQKRDGYIEGNNYMVTWCIGHLVELANPEVYDEKLKQWSFSTLPFIPDSFKYTVNSQTSKQFKIIKDLSNNPKIQSLINCADAGREGELIFHLVYLLTGCKKPVERLWISSLTKDEILKGFNNLKPAAHYAGLRDSAHARQRSDWLIGLNITRAFTLRLKSFKNIIGDVNSGKSELYSVGRVQTPTLAFIVNRENEINNFVPEKFYQVVATFDSTVGTYQGLWAGPDGFRIAEEKQAKAIVDKVLGQDGIIEKVDKKLVKEKSPLLHDLTSLQRVANTKYGLTADQTLKIAQSLYESKLLTYPRTSSQYLSTSVANEIDEHLEACNVGIYSQFVNQIKSQKIGVRLTSRHVQNDKVTDHHAIIPTKIKADLSSLDDDQRKVYDLVLRRFLAAFFPESEIEQTTVFTIVLGERFVSKGKVIINAGWRVVESPEALASGNTSSTTSKSKSKGKGKNSNPEDSQQEDEDKLLPPLKQNQAVETTLAEVLEKWTKPPSRYTEATLLSAMETAGKDIADDVLRQIMKDQGLGTPATRANTIETLISREYIFRDKKTLKPTDKGKLLIELLPSPLLKSAKLTAEWEQKLAEMAKGSYSLQAFMDEIKQATRELVKEVVTSNIADSPFLSRMKDEQQKEGKGSQSEQAEEGLICPNCVIEERKGRLVERTGQYGKFLCCSLGKEICKYISQVPKNQKQRKALVESRCPNCQGATKLHLPKEKDRSPALLCLNYNECKGVVRLEDAGSGSGKDVGKVVAVSDKSTNEQGNKQGNIGNKQTKTSSATEPMTKSNQAEKGLPCPKCVIEKREGCLTEHTGQYGNFLCCELGKEVCGYISSVPKDQKQRKALVESRCPNCKGATKLKFPTGKDKLPLLICLNYNECKGLIRLYNASAITPFDQNTYKNTDNSFIGSINNSNSNSDGFNNSNDSSNNKQSNIMKPVIVQSEFQRVKQTQVQTIVKNQNKILLRPGITNPKLWFPERPPEDEWRKIRQTVMERDNWTCASCGHRALKWMNTHHLSDSGDNNVENLVPLCVACHAVYHVGRSLMNGVVEIWKSDISQVEIVQRTRQGIIDGLSLAEIKAQLPIKPGFYPANSVDYANNLIKKMGNKPRAYLDEPLCAVFIKLDQWQTEADVKKATEANNFVSAKEIGQTPTQPLCKVCGKDTVKRSFKDKQGKEKYFWGCSAWKPNNQGCNATPIWIN